MADTSTKIISLANLQSYDTLIKKYVDDADKVINAKSLKCGALVGDTVYFFKTDSVPMTTGETPAVDTSKAAFSFEISSSDVDALKTRLGMSSTLNAYQSKTNVTDIVNVITGADSVEGSLAKVAKDAQTAVSTLENGQVKTNKEAIEAINNAETGILKTAKDYTDTLANGAVATNTAAIAAINNTETGILKTAKDYTDTLANGQVKTNKESIEAINDATTGILATAKKYADDEIKKLDATVTNVPEEGTAPDVQVQIVETDGKLVSVSATVTAERFDSYGSASAVQGSTTETVKSVDDKVEGVKTTIGDMTAVTTTSKEVAGAITELKAAVDSTGVAGKVTMTEAAGTGDVLKTYSFYQGVKADDTAEQKEAKKIGVISLAKDLVVTSGEVIVNPEGQAAGTYIKLTIANQETPIYINVKDLVEDFTVAASATEVQLAVSDAREISATLVDGGVATSKLADSAVTTAKIADKNVTLAKLADGVQTSLGLADSALQAADITTGSTNGTIAVEGTDVAVKGLDSAAYQPSSAFDAAGSATQALADAKQYADDLYEISSAADINALFSKEGE